MPLHQGVIFRASYIIRNAENFYPTILEFYVHVRSDLLLHGLHTIILIYENGDGFTRCVLRHKIRRLTSLMRLMALIHSVAQLHVMLSVIYYEVIDQKLYAIRPWLSESDAFLREWRWNNDLPFGMRPLTKIRIERSTGYLTTQYRHRL